MIGHIGMSNAMQTNNVQSVKSAENTAEVSEKELVQTDESRKYDRFESSEAYVKGSPDDPAARAAFDAKHKNADTSDKLDCYA